MNSKVVKRVMLLTGCKQDAEDAAQEAAIYNLKHPELSAPLLTLKAICIAKNNYRSTNKYGQIEYIDLSGTSRSQEVVEASLLVEGLFEHLSINEQRILTIFLRNDCNVIDSANNSEYSESSFKVLIFTLKRRLDRSMFV